MFAFIYNTVDYTNIKFITHKESALEEYHQEEEEAKENMDNEYCTGICLIEITGDGTFHMSNDFLAGDNVEIIAEWYLDLEE